MLYKRPQLCFQYTFFINAYKHILLTRGNKHLCLSNKYSKEIQSAEATRNKLFTIRLFFLKDLLLSTNTLKKKKFIFSCIRLFRLNCSNVRVMRNISTYLLYYNLFCGVIAFNLQLKAARYILFSPYIRDKFYNQSVIFFLNASKYMWSSPINFKNKQLHVYCGAHSTSTLCVHKQYYINNVTLKSNVYTLYAIRPPVFSKKACFFYMTFSKRIDKHTNLIRKPGAPIKKAQTQKKFSALQLKKASWLKKKKSSRFKHFFSSSKHATRFALNKKYTGPHKKKANTHFGTKYKNKFIRYLFKIKNKLLRYKKFDPFIYMRLKKFFLLVSRSRNRGTYFLQTYGKLYFFARSFFTFLKKKKKKRRTRQLSFKSLKKRYSASFSYKFFLNKIRLRKFRLHSKRPRKYKRLRFRFEYSFKKSNRKRRHYSKHWLFFLKWKLLLNCVYWHTLYKPTFNGYLNNCHTFSSIQIDMVNPNIFFFFHFFIFFFFLKQKVYSLMYFVSWSKLKSLYFFHLKHWRFSYITNFLSLFYYKKAKFIHILFKSTLNKVDFRKYVYIDRGDFLITVYYYYTRFLSVCFFLRRFCLKEISYLFFFFDYSINLMFLEFFSSKPILYIDTRLCKFFDVAHNFNLFSWLLTRYFSIFIYSRLLYLSRLFFFLIIIKQELFIFDFILLFNFSILFLDFYFFFSQKVFFFNQNHSLLIKQFVFSQKLLYIREFSFSFFLLLNLFKLRYNRIYINLQFNYLLNLATNIEYTLYSFSNLYYLFLPRFFFKMLPPMTNAKIVSDYIITWLRKGFRVGTVFLFFRKWQTLCYKSSLKQSLNMLRILGKSKIGSLSASFQDLFLESRFPVKGLRIVFAGPPYKARRKVKQRYHTWVSDDFVTGKMPLSTYDLHIDYFQSFAVIRRACIGVKVWLLFDYVE